MLIVDPDCLACVQCLRIIAKVGTGQAHLVRGGHGGVCCDECRSDEAGEPWGELSAADADLVFRARDAWKQ